MGGGKCIPPQMQNYPSPEPPTGEIRKGDPMVNSKQKGARGERQFRNKCREHGYDAKRTAQYCGNSGEASDVVGLPGIHIEVKVGGNIRLYDARDQAVHDAEAAGKGDLPIVAHKRDRDEWLITMRADDWFTLYREYASGVLLVEEGDRNGRCQVDQDHHGHV